MWNLIQAEWLKVRRCQILLVGIVALAVCPVVQLLFFRLKEHSIFRLY